MSDPTTSPAPAPSTTPRQTWAYVPEWFPIHQKFGDDLDALCKAFLDAGATLDMIQGAFSQQMWMMYDNMKDAVNATPPPAAPTPTPAPVPAPAPTSDATVELDANGISHAMLTAGDSVTLTIGAILQPDADTVPMLRLALDASATPVDVPAYSVELGYLTRNGITYTANGLWPNITIYGKKDDLMKLAIDDSGIISASISQDGGTSWTAFFKYAPAVSAPLYVHLTTTVNALAASVTAALK